MNKPDQIDRECIMDIDSLLNTSNECKTKFTRESASKLLLEVSCNSQGAITHGKGHVNLNGTTSNGSFEISMVGGPFGSLNMKTTFTGKYIGACK